MGRKPHRDGNGHIVKMGQTDVKPVKRAPGRILRLEGRKWRLVEDFQQTNEIMKSES